MENTRMISELKEILESQEFRCFKGELPFVVGQETGGRTVIYDLVQAPHILLGGCPGSGKTMFIHTIILSLLYRNSPERVKFLLLDQGMCDLYKYKYGEIPHVIRPVAMDLHESSKALKWAAAEAEKRRKDFEATRVCNLEEFNTLAAHSSCGDGRTQYTPYPRLVIIINELAVLHFQENREVRSAVDSLLDLGRAVGIHLIISTQSPSLVLTHRVDACIRSRIAFKLHKDESEVLLGMAGSEKLNSPGDMLFFPRDYQEPVRIQVPYLSYLDVGSVIEHIVSQKKWMDFSEVT